MKTASLVPLLPILCLLSPIVLSASILQPNPVSVAHSNSPCPPYRHTIDRLFDINTQCWEYNSVTHTYEQDPFTLAWVRTSALNKVRAAGFSAVVRAGDPLQPYLTVYCSRGHGQATVSLNYGRWEKTEHLMVNYSDDIRACEARLLDAFVHDFRPGPHAQLPAPYQYPTSYKLPLRD